MKATIRALIDTVLIFGLLVFLVDAAMVVGYHGADTANARGGADPVKYYVTVCEESDGNSHGKALAGAGFEMMKGTITHDEFFSVMDALDALD